MSADDDVCVALIIAAVSSNAGVARLSNYHLLHTETKIKLGQSNQATQRILSCLLQNGQLIVLAYIDKVGSQCDVVLDISLSQITGQTLHRIQVSGCYRLKRTPRTDSCEARLV